MRRRERTCREVHEKRIVRHRRQSPVSDSRSRCSISAFDRLQAKAPAASARPITTRLTLPVVSRPRLREEL
jgi:hypothetical protein